MKIIDVEPQPLEFMPPHTKGDKEYKGHGPEVYVKTDVYVKDGKLMARVYMKAVETQDDFTTAEGSEDFIIWAKQPVISLGASQKEATDWSYTDNNEEKDVSPVSPTNEPVKMFVCFGDNQGDDAGVYTKVIVTFNPLSIVV